MNQKLETICFNCNHFFPDVLNQPTEFGVCLQDEIFDSYIDELFEERPSQECCSLIDQKKFSVSRDACEHFEMVDQEIEIDDNSFLGKALKELIDKGEFSTKSFEEAVLKEQIQQMTSTMENLRFHLKQKNLRCLVSLNLGKRLLFLISQLRPAIF